MKRITIVATIIGSLTAVAFLSACADASAKYPQVVVYKNPTCECCTKWIDHLEEAGFKVKVSSTTNVAPLKRQHGVPTELQSCHTAVVGGYAVEGHVPPEDIVRLLSERPNVAGIAVPGMPMGSPGMEGPRNDPYQTIAFSADGSQAVFAQH